MFVRAPGQNPSNFFRHRVRLRSDLVRKVFVDRCGFHAKESHHANPFDFFLDFTCAALVMRGWAAHVYTIARHYMIGAGDRETLLCSRPTKGASCERHHLSDSFSEKIRSQMGKPRR